MENEEKIQAEKKVQEYMDEQEFSLAASVARTNNLIDRQIQAYDKMKEFWGHVPPKAGDQMTYIGLFKKAKDYYKASEGELSESCKNLDKLISTEIEIEPLEQSLSKISNYMNYLLDAREEQEKKDVWELINLVKESDKETIEDLQETIVWKPFMNNLLGFQGKN